MMEIAVFVLVAMAIAFVLVTMACFAIFAAKCDKLTVEIEYNSKKWVKENGL